MLFRQKGYAATSMRDIARAMSMEAASLYNHISSKQGILADLLLEVATYFTEGMAEIKASDASHLAKLRQVIAQHVDLTVAHTDKMALIPSEWTHLEEPALRDFLNMREGYEKALRDIVTKSIAEGGMKALDPDVILFSLLSTLRWLYSWKTKYQDKNPSELKEELVIALLDGLIEVE